LFLFETLDFFFELFELFGLLLVDFLLLSVFILFYKIKIKNNF
jgi:hypothetical protein